MVPTRTGISLALEIKPVLGEEGERTLWTETSKSSQTQPSIKLNFASCWGHFIALNIAKQQLLLKSTWEANSCHSLLTRSPPAVSGQKGQSKLGHGWCPCGTHVLHASLRLPWGSQDMAWEQWVAQCLPQLLVNVIVLILHGQTLHRWQSLPQE